jgi:hypothetical protein
MKKFYRRHFLTLLGHLDPIGQQNNSISDPKEVSFKELKTQPNPAAGQSLQIQSRGMEEMQEARVAFFFQPVAPDQAGDTSQVDSSGHGCGGENEPQKSAGP